MKELTKNRAALLGLFLTNPDRAFYLQEIGRLLGKKPGIFQRTINNLAAEGILTSEYKANARYFKVNKNYPLYQELKSIVFKTVGVTDALRAAVAQTGDVDFCFIYGSYAHGKENYMSDVDIVIVGSVNEDTLIRELDRLEDSLLREINYKLYDPAYFKKALARRDPFLSAILKDKKIMISGDERALRETSKR